MALVLFLTVLLALNKYALAAAGDIGEGCKSDKTCTDTVNVVCEEETTCKIKAEKSCATINDKCVKHSTCPTSGTKVCTCEANYAPSPTGLCRAKVALDATCTAEDTCADNTAVCDLSASKCKIKAGESCDGKTDKCVSQSTCSDTSKQCTCNDGFTPASTGLCSRNGGANSSISIFLLTGSMVMLLMTTFLSGESL